MTTNLSLFKFKKDPNELPRFDKIEIASQLQDYNSLFRFFWDYGNCVFNRAIPTACVTFNRGTGDFINFNFNPDFYKSLDVLTRSWICSHEMLHIMLEHGERFKEYPKEDTGILNQAADIVINEMTVDAFNFNREDIIGQEKYCWIDTIFEDTSIVERNRAFDYYYKLIKSGKNLKKREGGEGDGQGESGQLVDVHNFDELTKEQQKQVMDVIGKLAKGLTQSEMEKFFKNKPETDEAKKINDNLVNMQAGCGEGAWTKLNIGYVKKKKKWETVIKDWEKKAIREIEFDVERWDRKNRRFQDILDNKNCFLPTTVPMQTTDYLKKKILVFFALDTSGSTFHLKERFFKAAASLDPEVFDLRLLNFDSAAYETTLKSGKAYGGGGTNFSCINPKIEEICNRENKPFPRAVFAISDGYSCDHVNTKYPNRWHWFLISGSSKECIPKESKIYNLEDYE